MPSNGHVNASIDPPSYLNRAFNPAIGWERVPVAYATPWRPINANIGEQFRRYVADPVTNSPANAEVIRNVKIGIPGVFYAATGSAIDTAAADLPAGLDPRDTFLVRFEHSNGDKIDTQAALGSCLVGTAEAPAEFGGPAWTFDRGATVTIGITPLRANLRIQIVCYFIEYPGPSNYNPQG